RCTYADGYGNYTIDGLAAGSYFVYFGPGFTISAPRNLLGQYFDGHASVGAADPVSVAVGATHEHVDAALLAGGRISGDVVDAESGKPLEGVSVCALEAGDEEEPVSCGYTDALGSYSIANLPTGSYRVEFTDLEYEFDEEDELEEEEAPVTIERHARQFWQG